MRITPFAKLGIATIATVGLLTACSAPEAPAPAEDDITLRMTIWSANETHVALFEALGDEFAEASPTVSSVKIESFNLADLDTKFTNEIQAGNAPDVSWLPVESSLQYIRAGALVDLRPTLDATPDYDFDDLLPDLLERWVDGDSVYGVPFSTGPLGLYYNKDLYEQAGVKNPDQLIAEDNWTWDAFRETSKQLHDALGTPAFVLNDFDFKNWTRLLPYLVAYGASPWNDEATECTIDAPEAVDALSVFHAMTFDDASMPVPGQQVDFWGGQVGATSAFLGSSANLVDAGFEWGLVPTPAGPAGSTVATGQASIVALAAGNHTEEAAEFVSFLTTKESMATYSGYFPPIRDSILTAETLTANSEVLTPELVQPMIDGVKSSGQVFPVAADNSAVATELNSALDEFFYQPEADVADALTQVCDAIEPLLK